MHYGFRIADPFQEYFVFTESVSQVFSANKNWFTYADNIQTGSDVCHIVQMFCSKLCEKQTAID